MLSKRLVSISFLLIFLFSNIGWSINVHYCQGEAYYSALRYAQVHEHGDNGCTMDSEKEEDDCCAPPTSLKKTKQFSDKKCCENEVLKSTTSDYNTQHVYSQHFDFILPDYGWTDFSIHPFTIHSRKQEAFAYYIESHAPPLYQLYCRLVLYA